MQAIKKLSSFFNTVRQAIFHFKPNGFDCRKAKHCVIYTVTSYPDYSDYAQHITHIYITDPAIEFYGLSRNSSFEDFDYIMKQLKLTEQIAIKNGYAIAICHPKSQTSKALKEWLNSLSDKNIELVPLSVLVSDYS